MPFGKTYQEIIEMIKDALLYVPMCRAIVRRAGFVPGSGAGGSPKTLPLWLGGSYAAQSRFGYNAFNFPKGANLYPPLSLPSTHQHTLTDLANVAYVRMWVAWLGYDPLTSEVAFIPVYTNNMMPESLDAWIAPDGRTLEDWQADIDADSAPWPPPGAALDPIGGSQPGAVIGAKGEWYAPPIDALDDPTNVLLGVGVLVRGFVASMTFGDVAIQAAATPVSDAFNAYFFD